MADSASWSGGLEFAGFPINVKLYPLAGSAKNESFRQLDPKHGQPVKQQLVDVKGKVVPRDKIVKGHQTAPDAFVQLSGAALDNIALRERTKIMQPKQFSPRASVPLQLGKQTYAVVPDKKVAGSEGPVNIIWNGLRDNDLVYASELTMRAGSRDSIVVFYADEHGLWATTLPFVTELKDVPTHEFKVDAKQAAVFAQFVSMTYEVGEFDHASYVSEYKVRRDAAIEAALSGDPVPQPTADVEPADAPDLMAALEAAVSSQKAPKKKAAAKNGGGKKVSA